MTATELPALTDKNPDMIRIAENDRIVMLDRLTADLTATGSNQPAELVAELVAVYRDVALRHTDAGWWLRNNSYRLGPILQREFTDADKTRVAQLASRRR